MNIMQNNNFNQIKGLLAFILIISGLWIGITTILETDSPVFVVSSGSMIPVLEVGDIIVVSGKNYFNNLIIGDIIVFTLPTDQNRVIVHRVHEINTERSETIIKTKGDNNPYVDGWKVKENNYIGTVIIIVPYIGKLSMWITPPTNYYIITIIIIVLLTNEVKKRNKKI